MKADQSKTSLVPWEPLLCRGCGWALAIHSGDYCLECMPLSMDDDDEWGDDEFEGDE